MSFQSRIVPAPTLTTPSASRFAFAGRATFILVLWRQRLVMRRALARMDARSLRDAGISPAAAAHEAAKPFWRKSSPLR